MTSPAKPTSLYSLQWWLLLLLTLVFIAITMKLGFWQLSRAQLRERIDAEQRDSATQAPLSGDDLRALPPGAKPLYRRVNVAGQWLPSWTLFLNRPQNGRPGFWVMTPMQLPNGLVVLVQRGWVPRDPVLADKPLVEAEPCTRQCAGPVDRATFAHDGVVDTGTEQRGIDASAAKSGAG
jgi:cytochrome oxidase assembly protein ShyY1